VLVTLSPGVEPDGPVPAQRNTWKACAAEVDGRGGDGALAQTPAFEGRLLLVQHPQERRLPFLAVVEHTNFVSPENFGGDHIVYMGDYLEPEHEYFRLTQDELLERFAALAEEVQPRFQPGLGQEGLAEPHRLRPACAAGQPLEEHPAIQTPIEGLYFASMSQVYPWDRGTNFAVEIGRRAAG
jgi:hypothetical protein